MLKRDIEEKIRYTAAYYPVIAVTGPRQSGKTTLVKKMFSHLPYVSLEDPDIREVARNDPRGFLELYKGGAILDEVQHVPELFSYLQTLVDKQQKPGQYVLTGSQNFLLHEKITQSLAGRVALHTLLPLSISEAPKESDYHYFLLKGFYPKLHVSDLRPPTFYSNYIKTYVERDVRRLLNVKDLNTFQQFLKLCAGHVGQLINYSALGNMCSISYNTAKQWISLLKASYILTTIPPYYKNISKRLVKQEKLYFYDVGLACYLLNITSYDHLYPHPLKGALFENMVMMEVIKHAYLEHKEGRIFFWRDHHQNELDLIIENDELIPIEIKSGKTFVDSFMKNHRYWERTHGQAKGYIIYGGYQPLIQKGIKILPWNQLGAVLEELKDKD